jgi:putative flippase GtrA
VKWFDPAIVGKLARFGGVGVLATIVHILVALAARNAFGLAPLLANFVGFGVAFLVSYIGHERFTFGASETALPQFLRFLFVAVFGLAVSTSTVWLIDIKLGLGFTFAMISVGVLVPAATFVALRFWAFGTTA